DGIRDRNVTGVQTCALPISTQSAKAKPIPMTLLISASSLISTLSRLCLISVFKAIVLMYYQFVGLKLISAASPGLVTVYCFFQRSEERRVGKECGCRLLS